MPQRLKLRLLCRVLATYSRRAQGVDICMQDANTTPSRVEAPEIPACIQVLMARAIHPRAGRAICRDPKEVAELPHRHRCDNAMLSVVATMRPRSEF